MRLELRGRGKKNANEKTDGLSHLKFVRFHGIKVFLRAAKQKQVEQPLPQTFLKSSLL